MKIISEGAAGNYEDASSLCNAHDGAALKICGECWRVIWNSVASAFPAACRGELQFRN
jgi:hypothetical protein